MKPTSFSVEIDESLLQDLRRRLLSTRWADDYGNADWRFGVEKSWLQDMVSYWANEFDWRAQEQRMNAYPQFRVRIDDVTLHFMHIRGKGPNSVPLVLTHGWPWTFWDWEAMIGPLSDPAAHGGDPADSFDLVIPSLPGFGFSTPLSVPDLTVHQNAATWVKLMRDVLGYDKFAAAGGDYGAILTSEIGFTHGEHLIGAYLMLPYLYGIDPSTIRREDYAQDEAWMPRRVKEAAPTIRSHVAVHTLDPQTLAYALADSPVGTAAWIWERRRAWSDCNGDVVALHGKDFLCTLASIYWLTNTIGTSVRAYPGVFHPRVKRPDHSKDYIRVPTGFGIAPQDVGMMPKSFAQRYVNVQAWDVLQEGGHFNPSEKPAAVAANLRSFFGMLR